MLPLSLSAFPRTLRGALCRQLAEDFALREEQWEAIGDLFPAQRRGGRWRNHRQALGGVLFMARGHGSAWRDLPPQFGPWQAVYWRYRRCQRDGTLALMLARIAAPATSAASSAATAPCRQAASRAR